jgi:glycosyltransferase involved in cell wall biosynthesis
MSTVATATPVLSCVVPVHNEAAGIQHFLQALRQQLQQLQISYEILVVDDGSTDASIALVTALAAELPALKLIALSRNFGKEIALSAGLEYARGQAVILLDADFQHPLELIPTMVQQWQQGYAMVYGVCTEREHYGWCKRLLTRTFYQLMQLIAQVPLVPHAGDFRLLDRAVVNAINACPERNRFMKGLYAWVGYPSIALPFTIAARLEGKTRWSFRSLYRLAMTGIISFSDVPLRIWGIIGFGIAALSFLSAAYMVCKAWLFGYDLPGYPSIMVAIIFFGGVQLLSIGILGEYIARIFCEVKQRPKYFVKQTVNLHH